MMERYILPAAAAIALSALTLFIHARSADSGHRDPSMHRTQSPGTDHKIFAPGRVEGTTLETDLRPQVQGRVVEVTMAEGQHVLAGQLILQLDNRQFESELRIAQAELARVKMEKIRLENGARPEERRESEAFYRAKLSELELATSISRRSSNLQNLDAISNQEVERRDAAVKLLTAEVVAAEARAQLLNAPPREEDVQIAAARISAAEASVTAAQIQWEHTQLRAPIAGQILKINAEAGELAGPASLAPTVIMADTSRYFVRAFVEELDAPRLAVGMSATITADGLPNESFVGDVVRVSPRMSQKALRTDAPTERYDTKIREALIELSANHGLVVGLRVDVMIDATDTQ